ncbi:GNAT family N-acetyltransferase [Thioclava sp. JE_KL1]|uniref:GNAT family N-acetyltransferase n=1 Tax=Thioclava sp. JE_KL1 TaxID=2651187 RepID=UPI00128C6DBA|nr:GNAT family N-acetyltransferase [Thioclava sp. JE_KL1]MPQ95464.1 GNAT family N-acetyltransferase [Thioclava sp. JE_KL1]
MAAMKPVRLTQISGSDAGWDRGLRALAPGQAPAFQQAALYGTLAAARGRRVLRLEITEAGRRIALAQMIGRGGLWLLSRGPVFAPGLDHSLRVAVLRRIARRWGIVLATPDASLAGIGLVPLITPRHHALWSLQPETKALRAGLAGKWRNRLAAAERARLQVRIEPEIDWLLAADAAQQRARGYRALPPGFTRAWADHNPADFLALLVEDTNRQRLAGGIFLLHGEGASYHIGWTGPQGRMSGAHNLMLWHAALRLKARGIRQLDLGAVDSEDGAGRMRFKLGTGAQPHSLGATLWVLPR